MNRYFTYFGIFLLLISLSSFGQHKLSKNSNTIFSHAKIRMDTYGKAPLEIRFPEGTQVTVTTFFEEYKNAFNLSNENTFGVFKVFTDQIGQTHYRCKQFYKNVEVTEIQYLLHERKF